MSHISDLEWAEATGGRLSRLQSAAYIRDITLLMARRLLPRGRRQMPTDTFDFQSAIHLPDTSIVAAAVEQCREACHPAIAVHCLRTFAWASLVGAARGLTYDREALAVAALLHDLELGQIARRADTGCACFACASALAAERFAIMHGRDRDWARRVGDAIARHLDPVVSFDYGVEAHLWQAGAGIDVIGAGLGIIPKAVRTRVLAVMPRNGFMNVMTDCMEREGRLGGRTRASCLMSIGFGRRIRDAPFP